MARFVLVHGNFRGAWSFEPYPSSLSRAELDAAGRAYEMIDAAHIAPVSVPGVVATWLGSLAPSAGHCTAGCEP